MICDICDDCIHNAVCDRKAVLERIPYMTHCTYKHTEADIINPELEKIRAKIRKYRSTIDKAISEDELKIEGMKEAYTDLLNILD